jgi:ubiquinone biosynthesis protein
VEQGRLAAGVRPLAGERDRRVITGLTPRFLLTLLGTVAGVVAAVLLAAHGGPAVSPHVSPFQVIGCNLLIAACVLVLRVLFTIFGQRDMPGR